ncbi:MAG: VOC family protein [Marinomonas sp.]
MISHFDHIVLTVANIDRAVSFYETVLKMEAITFGDGRKAVKFGQQKINLQLLGEELRNHAMEGSGDLCLITDWAMDDVIAHLKECDVSILEGPVAKSGAQGPIESVYFNDPDNNLIEVSVYLDSTENEPVEPSSDSIETDTNEKEAE